MFPLRDENPRRTFAVVTLGIIAINLYVFWQMLFLKDAQEVQFVYRYAPTPFEFWQVVSGQHPHILVFLKKIVACQFMHGGFIHIASNLWFLWIFGDNVEARFGPLRFSLFYLMCGVLGCLGHFVVAPQSTVPIVGASGAIAGVLGAYLVFFPRVRILSLVPVFIFLMFLRVRPGYFWCFGLLYSSRD